MKLKSNYHEVYDYLITQYHDGLFYHRKSDVKSLEQLYDNFFTLYNPEKLHWCNKKLFPQVNQLNYKEIRNKIIDNRYDYKDNYMICYAKFGDILYKKYFVIKDVNTVGKKIRVEDCEPFVTWKMLLCDLHNDDYMKSKIETLQKENKSPTGFLVVLLKFGIENITYYDNIPLYVLGLDVDHQSVVQEIEMSLYQYNNTECDVEIADADKIIQHGFDNKSFKHRVK